MSIEHVEDLLSAYLDNALTQEEQAQVATHLRTCAACSTVLADFRHFDTLLAKQPRVSPSTALREKIFSSPEYLELIGAVPKQITTGGISSVGDVGKQQDIPSKGIHLDQTSRPRLISIPGNKKSPLSEQETKARIRVPQRQHIQIQHFMQILIAACLLLTVGVGSFIGWNLWHGQGKTAGDAPGITPPQSLHQGGPLSAGMRFVFLQGNSLWSAPEDGSTQAVRLTPATVEVAPHWVVGPPSPNHVAGNLLAYVDTKYAYVHIIRSDGQSDTLIKQPLLQDSSKASWNTATGTTILNSLSWSPDGQTLAFIAGPAETSALFLYSTSTNHIQSVALPEKGILSHLVWSPNGVRIAFSLAHNMVTSVLDYNVVTRQVLTVATLTNPNDTVLTLDWAATNNTPAITWSAGIQGHVHSIWVRHVGDANGVDGVQPLSSGEYTQAVYSRSGEQGLGSWLLVRALPANTDTILTLTLAGAINTVANGSQIDMAQWTPDGKHITYFDSFSSGVGTLHSIDTTNNSNMLVARTVYSTPAPIWSSDQRHIMYSTETASFVADVTNGKTQLVVQSMASAFVWSTTAQYTVVVATPKGIHIVDIDQNTSKVSSTTDVTGPIVWTQIP